MAKIEKDVAAYETWPAYVPHAITKAGIPFLPGSVVLDQAIRRREPSLAIHPASCSLLPGSIG